jgi:hypothetical protein
VYAIVGGNAMIKCCNSIKFFMPDGTTEEVSVGVGNVSLLTITEDNTVLIDYTDGQWQMLNYVIPWCATGTYEKGDKA